MKLGIAVQVDGMKKHLCRTREAFRVAARSRSSLGQA